MNSFIIENRVRCFKELIQAADLKAAHVFAAWMFENSSFSVRPAKAAEVEGMKVFWVVE